MAANGVPCVSAVGAVEGPEDRMNRAFDGTEPSQTETARTA